MTTVSSVDLSSASDATLLELMQRVLAEMSRRAAAQAPADCALCGASNPVRVDVISDSAPRFSCQACRASWTAASPPVRPVDVGMTASTVSRKAVENAVAFGKEQMRQVLNARRCLPADVPPEPPQTAANAEAKAESPAIPGVGNEKPEE